MKNSNKKHIKHKKQTKTFKKMFFTSLHLNRNHFRCQKTFSFLENFMFSMQWPILSFLKNCYSFEAKIFFLEITHFFWKKFIGFGTVAGRILSKVLHCPVNILPAFGQGLVRIWANFLRHLGKSALICTSQSRFGQIHTCSNIEGNTEYDTT